MSRAVVEAIGDPARREPLDRIDLAIIAKLQHDGRITVRRLARAVAMSETAVRQRLNRLVATKAISIVGLVDPQALGRPLIAWCLIRTDASGSEVGRRLAALHQIRWVARCGDFDQLIAQTSCADNEELLEIVNLRVRATKGVKSVETLIQLRTHVTEFRFSAAGDEFARPSEVWVRGGHPSRLLDETDRIIADALHNDGRTTFKKLGDLTGLTTASARQRYQRLVRDGILRVRAVADPAWLGRTVSGLLGITVRGSSSDTAAMLARHPEATFVCECAGRYDVLVEVVCRDQAHFSSVFHDAVAAAPGVGTVDAYVYHDVVKESFDF